MKQLLSISALMTIVLGALVISSAYNAPEAQNEVINAVEVEEESDYEEEPQTISGMFFSSEYVTEEYEYDDAYCIVYDDPDANMFDVEICVDLETYKRVMYCANHDKKMVGTLVRNEELSNDSLEVFSFMPKIEVCNLCLSATK